MNLNKVTLYLEELLLYKEGFLTLSSLVEKNLMNKKEMSIEEINFEFYKIKSAIDARVEEMKYASQNNLQA